MMKSIIKVQLLLCLAVLCVLPASAGNGRGLRAWVVDDDTIIDKSSTAYAIEGYMGQFVGDDTDDCITYWPDLPTGFVPRLLGVREPFFRSGDDCFWGYHNQMFEYDVQGRVSAVTHLAPSEYSHTLYKMTYTYEPNVIKAVSVDLESPYLLDNKHLYRLDDQGRVIHCVSTVRLFMGDYSPYFIDEALEYGDYHTYQTFYHYDKQGRLEEVVSIDTMLSLRYSEDNKPLQPIPDTTVWQLKWEGENIVQVIANSNTRRKDSTVYTYIKCLDALGTSIFLFGSWIRYNVDVALWMQGYFGKRNANMLKTVDDEAVSRTLGDYFEVLKERGGFFDSPIEYFWEYIPEKVSEVDEPME